MTEDGVIGLSLPVHWSVVRLEHFLQPTYVHMHIYKQESYAYAYACTQTQRYYTHTHTHTSLAGLRAVWW